MVLGRCNLWGCCNFFAYVVFWCRFNSTEQTSILKDMPFAIIASLSSLPLLYILVSLVLTGMIHHQRDFISRKYPEAIRNSICFMHLILDSLGWLHHYHCCNYWFNLVIDGNDYVGQSRTLFGMSKDGLIPSVFSKINLYLRLQKLICVLGGFIWCCCIYSNK